MIIFMIDYSIVKNLVISSEIVTHCFIENFDVSSNLELCSIFVFKCHWISDCMDCSSIYGLLENADY